MYDSDRLLPEKYAAMQMGYWMDYLVIFSFCAVFLMGRGFSATEIGYVTTSGAVLTILLQMSLSSLADRSQKISLKEILIALMLGGISAAGIMMLLPRSHLATFVCMFVALSLTNTLSPLLTSLCLQYNDGGARINFGVTRSLGSLGYALAAFVMGRVTEAFGAEIILPIYCVIYALMILLLATMKRPVRVSLNVEEAESKPAEQPSSLIRFFANYRRYDIFLLAVMCMFFMVMLLNTYMIYFVNSFGGGEAEMGTALFVSAFSEMPAVALGLTLLKRFSAQKLLRVSALASFVKCGGLLFIPNSGWFIGLQALQFFCSGMYMVASVYFISSIVRRADGVKAQAILAVGLSGVTGIAGNIIGGYMLERLPVRMIILLGTIVAAVGVALMFIATSKHPMKGETQSAEIGSPQQ